jgi:hypothetical protein
MPAPEGRLTYERLLRNAQVDSAQALMKIATLLEAIAVKMGAVAAPEPPPADEIVVQPEVEAPAAVEEEKPDEG